MLAVFLAGCGEAPKQPAAPPPPKVTVAKPTTRTIIDQDEYVGRFIAVDRVDVHARVSGYLEKVHFEDGQLVKEGDLLFTIDKRPFQNTLAQARANLETARSNLTFTEADVARGRQLLRDRTMSEQVFEQRAQAFRNAQASVAANEAVVRQAELDLEFTELKAPISGRIGDRRVTTGNLVTGGTGGMPTLLAIIVSIDPIRLEFTFDEASLLRYERLSRGDNVDLARRKMPVQIAAHRRGGVSPTTAGWISSTMWSIARPARSAAARNSPMPMACSPPGCSRGSKCRAPIRIKRCWCPMPPSAPSRRANIVLVVNGDDVATQKYVTLGEVGRRPARDQVGNFQR